MHLGVLQSYFVVPRLYAVISAIKICILRIISYRIIQNLYSNIFYIMEFLDLSEINVPFFSNNKKNHLLKIDRILEFLLLFLTIIHKNNAFIFL